MNTREGSPVYAAHSQIPLALLGMSLFWLGSCRTEPPGQISIDRAEVFTRERLVNRRLQEQQWLEKKLDFANLETTFQGTSDLREFRGLMAALKGQFDPLGGALQEATLNSQLKDRQRQEELAARKQETSLLQAEIDKLKAEQDLAKLKQTPGAGVSGSSATTSPPAASPTAGTPPDASKLAGTWETLQRSVPSDTQDARTASTSTRLTSVEKLRDEMAYRNAVHAALREAELDDAHDINGYTLRTLKFDISVIPRDERAEHIGMIRLTAEPNAVLFDDPNELADVYRAWQETVLQQTQLEALSLQRRYLQGLITDDDIVQYVAARRHVQEALRRLIEEPGDTSDNERPVHDPERERQLNGAVEALDALQLNGPSRQLDPNTSMALCKIVEWRYATLHSKYLYFNDIPTRVEVDGKMLCLPDLWPSPDTIDEAEHHFPRKGSKTWEYRERVLAPLTKDEIPKTWDYRRRGRAASTKEAPSVREAEWEARKAAAVEEAACLRRGGSAEQLRCAQLSYEIRKDTERLHDFIEAIYCLDSEFKPYIYTVEPKELAQNISDVAAAERLSSLVLAAGAALPSGGVSADGYLSQLNRSQLRLQAILRRPLVVGFVGREDYEEDKSLASFGWALGPRFEIGPGRGVLGTPFGRSRTQVHYHQAEAQHSVQATMALPGWLDRIVFKYQVGWRDPSAGWAPEREMTVQWKQERRLTVDLSRDYEAITSALLGRHEAREQEPTILPAKSGDSRAATYLLTEGDEKAGLLIRGANLWRNPQVFVGGQKAETVAVLPDMGGLYATFDKVRLPTTADRGSARVDLTIVTSQGVARLSEAVQILPKAMVKPSGTVELKTTCAVPNGKVQFTAAYGLIADTSHFGARLRARDATRMTWSDVIVTSVTRKMGEGGATEIEFELDPSRKLATQPARLTFDLAIRDEDGAPYRSIPSFAGVKGELAYFPRADQAGLRAAREPWIIRKEAPPSSSDKPGVVTCCASSDLVFQTDPNVSLDLFKWAHPWIAEEKTAFRVEFAFADGKPPILVPLGPGELQLSGNKPGIICVRKSRLIGRKPGEEGSKEAALFDLYERLAGAAAAPKDVKVAIRHPNGKDSVEVNDKLVLTAEPAVPGKTPGNRE